MVIAKILVFIVNFVLWVSGILLIVFGSIALASPSTIVNLLNLINGVSNITILVNVGNLLYGMAVFMIVDGCVLFLFGGVGCHGILLKHKTSLMSYWLMLLLGILTEIGVIIYGAVYPPTAQSSIQSQMFSSLSTGQFAPVNISSGGALVYNSQASVSGAWEYLQSQTQCCGAYGFTDYLNFTWTIPGFVNSQPALAPPTCCKSTVAPGTFVQDIIQLPGYPTCITAPTVNNVYSLGCYNVAMDMLWNFNYIAIIIASCLIATQLIGTIITVHTWHKMMRDV